MVARLGAGNLLPRHDDAGNDLATERLLGWPGLLDHAAVRRRSRGWHHASGNDAPCAWARAVERGICPAFEKTCGRTIHPQSDAEPALLSVPGGDEAISREYRGPVHGFAGCARLRHL